MSDDDHYFVRRIDVRQPKLRPCKERDVEELFERVEALLDKYPMVGLSARQKNDAFLGRKSDGRVNREFAPGLVLCERVSNFYGMRVDILQKHNIQFSAISAYEDFHVALSLMEHGYVSAGNNRMGLERCERFRRMFYLLYVQESI